MRRFTSRRRMHASSSVFTSTSSGHTPARWMRLSVRSTSSEADEWRRPFIMMEHVKLSTGTHSSSMFDTKPHAAETSPVEIA